MKLNFKLFPEKSSQTAVLLIYTGGTIGMKEDPADGTLRPFDFSGILEEVPELRKFAVKIDSYTFNPLIDSSDVEPSLWQALARLIRDRYDDYDGFVVLHGTDTMAYSASALSFMLENLGKPVVFTGSQLPIGKLRTDGKENLISAVEIAAAKDSHRHPMVPEVSICFNAQLLRGNRSVKVNATGFDAFKSPNYPPLATAGISIKYNNSFIHYGYDRRKGLTVHTDLDTRVSVLKLHPGITEQAVRDILLGVVPLARAGGRLAGEDPPQRHAVHERRRGHGPVCDRTRPEGRGRGLRARHHHGERARKALLPDGRARGQRKGQGPSREEFERRNIKIIID